MSTNRESLSATNRNSLIQHKKNEELSAGYDYVLVFPMDGTPGAYTQTAASKFVVDEMTKAGLETFSYLSIQDDELIVLVRCPVRSLFYLRFYNLKICHYNFFIHLYRMKS
jgi:hypothetical protein